MIRKIPSHPYPTYKAVSLHTLVIIFRNEWYAARGRTIPQGSLCQLDPLTSQAFKLPQKHVRTTVSRESKSRATPASPRCAQLELVMGSRLLRGSRYMSLLLGIIVTGVPTRQLIKRTQRAYLVYCSIGLPRRKQLCTSLDLYLVYISVAYALAVYWKL